MENTARKVTPKEEPSYLRENWKRVLATDCQDRYKFVRVIRNVATITNGKLMIRSPVPEKDGLYVITSTNSLTPTKTTWINYPDVELVRPPFESMRPFCTLKNTVVHDMVNFAEQVRRVDGYIVIDHEWMCMRQKPEFHIKYPFKVSGDPITLSPNYLKLALIEMLRYDFVYMSREESLDKQTPLVFGHRWDTCSLVVPLTPTLV